MDYLKAFADFYDNEIAKHNPNMPPEGFSSELAAFAILINDKGNVTGVEDLRKDKRGQPLILPEHALGRSGGAIVSDFLYGDTAYALGFKNNEKETEKFSAFAAKFQEIVGDSTDPGVLAFNKFLKSWGKDTSKAKTLSFWKDVDGNSVVFKYGDGFLHDRKSIKRAWLSYLKKSSQGESIRCMDTNQVQIAARLHPAIKNLAAVGGRTSGAYLVSFNNNIFCSWNKDSSDQGFNAPLSTDLVRKYPAALNYMLREGSPYKALVGGTMLLCWTASDPTGSVDLFSKLYLGMLSVPQDEEVSLELLKILSNPDLSAPLLNSDVKVYLLGLRASARISIVFSHEDTVGNLANRLLKTYKELALSSDEGDSPIMGILASCFGGKVPPPAARGMLRSMLSDSKYPSGLLLTTLGRVKVGRAVHPKKAKMIKACLIRNFNQEVSMELDEKRNDIPYLLGRLLAVMNKVKLDIKPNAPSIESRFLSSAMSSPASTFPFISKEHVHHITKLQATRPGMARYYRTLIDDIKSRINEYPHHLTSLEQGLFDIGFYHQRHSFFMKKTTEQEAPGTL